MKNKENLHLSLCAHVTSLHLLKIFQAEVLWQSRATRLWSLLWRWVRLLSILSHHSIFSFWLLPILSHHFCLGPLTISRSSMYIFVSGLGGHWDAEHCQGAAEGADKDCGSVAVHTLKSLMLYIYIYVPSQFFSDILRNSERWRYFNVEPYCVHFLFWRPEYQPSWFPEVVVTKVKKNLFLLIHTFMSFVYLCWSCVNF